MKILYVTTIGSTMGFFTHFIKDLCSEGHTVDIAANQVERPVPECYREWNCVIHPISCSRSPFSPGNITAVKQLRKLVAAGGYDIVHCHTPIAAACARLACIGARKRGTRVIYTAHGFHFYKGASRKNWLIFYPIEWLCSFMTDVLITINQEDYRRAQKMGAKRVVYVPGVGIDVQKFADAEVDAAAKRREIGVPEEAFLLLSVGELNSNKNHETVIRALSQLKNDKIHYTIAGRGNREAYLQELAGSLGLEKQVHLLGYRTDVAQLYKTADVFVHPSFREGLPVAVMEALASGLPVIASRIRGNTDLITDGETGFLVKPTDIDAYMRSIRKMMDHRAGATDMRRACMHAAQAYGTDRVNKCVWEIYKNS